MAAFIVPSLSLSLAFAGLRCRPDAWTFPVPDSLSWSGAPAVPIAISLSGIWWGIRTDPRHSQSPDLHRVCVKALCKLARMCWGDGVAPGRKLGPQGENPTQTHLWQHNSAVCFSYSVISDCFNLNQRATLQLTDWNPKSPQKPPYRVSFFVIWKQQMIIWPSAASKNRFTSKSNQDFSVSSNKR